MLINNRSGIIRMNITKTVIIFLSISIPASLSYAQQVKVIRGGTILTMSGDRIENGMIIIRGNKISDVGRNLTIPANAEIIEAQGKYVMPGLIDAMSYYGIRPFSPNDTSDPVTAENRIVDAFYPYGKQMRGKSGIQRDIESLKGGVTSIYIAPGNRQLISGQGAVVKLYSKDHSGLIVTECASIDMALGDPVKATFRTKSPSSRMSIAALMRKTLLAAQAFKEKIEKYESKSAEEKEKAQKPARDLGNEALLRLINKEIPARIEAELPDDILTAIRISEEFDFNLIIDAGIGAYKVRHILAEKKIPVVLSPISHPFTYAEAGSWTTETYALNDERNAGLLADAGVKIAIASFGRGSGFEGSAYRGRWLLHEAAIATGYGLSDEDALKAVTINAAEILGVDSRLGSIEKGKDADIIILDGEPLKLKTWVTKVIIDGELLYDKNK